MLHEFNGTITETVNTMAMTTGGGASGVGSSNCIDYGQYQAGCTTYWNGYPVYTLELFAKHPTSRTLLYNTENAPNLIRGSRYEQRERGGKPNWTFDEFGVSH